MVPLGFHFMHACQTCKRWIHPDTERERDRSGRTHRYTRIHNKTQHNTTHTHNAIYTESLVSLLHHSPFCLSIIATVIVIIMIVYCIAFLYFYCPSTHTHTHTQSEYALAVALPLSLCRPHVIPLQPSLCIPNQYSFVMRIHCTST